MSAGGLPQAVRQARDEARAAIEARGRLSLAERRVLRLAVFGPWTPTEAPGGPDAGLLRRAELGAACARRVLPLWERSFPADRRPHELVEVGLRMARGEVGDSELIAAYEPVRDVLEPLGADPTTYVPFGAGMTAVKAAIEASEGEPDPDLVPLDAEDTDLDEPVVERMAAYTLSLEDLALEPAFWRWYVDEAVPAAWAAVP
jgi:hypothetical protein